MSSTNSLSSQGDSAPVEDNNGTEALSLPHLEDSQASDAKNDHGSPLDEASEEEPARGRKRNRKEFTISVWYEACQQFMSDPGQYQNSQVQFLRSPDSGLLTESNKVSFGKRLRAFKEGRLPQDDSIKRVRKGKYHNVEKCLIAYLEARQSCSKGKMAVTWPFLTQLAKKFAVALGYDEQTFRASPGWLSNVLKRNKTTLTDDIDEHDVLVYLDMVKKYCKKVNLGRETEMQCDRLQKMIQKETRPEEDTLLGEEEPDSYQRLLAADPRQPNWNFWPPPQQNM